MLDEADVDAVCIATPNFTHKDITLAAARRGRHVFCEKAMATTVADCWAMVRACRSANVRLMVGHKRRLRPAWARMIELRESLGGVAAATVTLYHDARSYDWKGWWTQVEGCGGTLFLNGVHSTDWLRAICGDVLTVRAVAGPVIDPRYEFPDTVHVTLTFRSGSVASLNVALNYPLAQFREAVGPTVTCREGGMRLHTYTDRLELHWQRHRDQTPTVEHFRDLGYEHAYRTEISDFVRWINDDAQPCLTWIEGLRCVEVMEAARRSADAGGTIVTLHRMEEPDEQEKGQRQYPDERER